MNDTQVIILVLGAPFVLGLIIGAFWGHGKGLAKAEQISFLRDKPTIDHIEHEAFQNGYDAATRDLKDEVQDLRDIIEHAGLNDIDEDAYKYLDEQTEALIAPAIQSAHQR